MHNVKEDVDVYEMYGKDSKIAKDEFNVIVSAEGNATYDGGYLGLISVTCSGHVTYYNPNKEVDRIEFRTSVLAF